jgi:hypothetical protein
MSKSVDYRKARRFNALAAEKDWDDLTFAELAVDASGNTESCSKDCSLSEKGYEPSKRRRRVRRCTRYDTGDSHATVANTMKTEA